MSQELVEFSLEPKSLDEALKLAKIISESDMVPKDYKGKPANVLIAVQMGREVGLKPMQAIQNIAIINSRPCLWGDVLPAIVEASNTVEDFREDFDEKTMTATCTGKRKGRPTLIVNTFSKEDAIKAGLWSKEGTWQTHPKRMLKLRARAFTCRDGWPDHLKGLAVAEEMMDIPISNTQAIAEPQKLEAPKQTETEKASELNTTKKNGENDYRDYELKREAVCSECRDTHPKGWKVLYSPSRQSIKCKVCEKKPDAQTVKPVEEVKL